MQRKRILLPYQPLLCYLGSIDQLNVDFIIFILFSILKLVYGSISTSLFLLLLFLLDLMSLLSCIFLLEHANSRLQSSLLLKSNPLWKKRQRNTHKCLVTKQVVNKIIYVDDWVLSDHISDPQLAIVIYEGLQSLICLSSFQNQPKVK